MLKCQYPVSKYFVRYNFITCPRRYYHPLQPIFSAHESLSDQPKPNAENNQKGDDVRTQILRSSLNYVPTHGWESALAKGTASMPYSSVVIGLFPRKGMDLVEFFLVSSRNRMTSELEGKMEGLKVHEKIRLACQTRLSYTQPFASKWSEALAIMSQPNNVISSVEELQKLVDDMWYLAEDKSADMNWYTKRISLAGIYTSTELYMTQDNSPQFIDTYQFLDRRLNDVSSLGKGLNQLSDITNFAARSFFGIISSRV